MPISVTVNRKTYESTNKKHAEEVMFESGKHNGGDLAVEMDGWPCTGERGHDCHRLFTNRSAGRTITVTVGGATCSRKIQTGSHHLFPQSVSPPDKSLP